MVQEGYRTPLSELQRRWEASRRALDEFQPEAGGLLVFSRIHVYWLTGSLAMGACWLPRQGEPVLLARKGGERSRLESPLKHVLNYTSFKEFPDLLAGVGVPLSATVAVDKAVLTWQLAEMLTARLPEVAFMAADQALAVAQSVKSEYELDILRRCGAAHHESLFHDLPRRIRPGMTERQMAHLAWASFFDHGHMGHMRMQAFGEEIFLGYVSVGESGNYSSAFNGPLGVVGEHPAIPYMGSAEVAWEPGRTLACDIGFSLEGYCTDKTQVYFAGKEKDIPDAIRRAHDFCIRVQALAASEARPGNTPAGVYQAALDLARDEDMLGGFMGTGGNKVPFLGHGIGLTIDAWPPLAKGFDRPLEAGMVLALEPKQSVPGLGMVGVENTFEVREGGAVCITGDAYDIICVD